MFNIKRVELNVYTKAGELLGIIDKYNSLIWTRKLYEPSTFEFEFILDSNTAQLAKLHNIVEKPDTHEAGYIKDVRITQDMEKGTLVTVSGECLTSVMYQRLIRNQASTVLGYFRANVLDCDDYYYRETSALTTPTFPQDYPALFAENENLGEVVEALLRKNGLGIKCLWAGYYGTVDLVLGVDRSINQSTNPQVVFSTEFDNLASSEYSVSANGIITSCFVRMLNPNNLVPQYGAGITEDLLVGFSTGVDRAETHTTCEAVPKVETVNGQTRTYLDVDATLLAMQAAGEALFVKQTENFVGTVHASAGYRTEWDLGDIVTVENKAWGTSVNEHVTEVCEVFDAGGFKVEPTFGERTLNVIDLLKIKMR